MKSQIWEQSMEECFNTTIDIKHEKRKEKEKPTQNQKQETTTGQSSSLAAIEKGQQKAGP